MAETIAIEKELDSALKMPEQVNVSINTRRNIQWKIFNAIRYVLPYPRKIVNYLGIKSALLAHNPKHKFFPFKLGVEASSRCNLKCPLCPRTANTARPTGDMDYEPYTKLIDTMAPYLFQVRFHNLGEPTLNPRLPDMITYAHRKGMYTNFHTNGHYLTEKLASDLIDSGLDEVNIALDGLSEDVYRKYRVNGSAERVKKGISDFCRIKKEKKSRSPRINIQFLVMSHNEHEIPELHDFAAAAGVDWVFLKPVNIMIGVDTGNKEYLPSNSKYSRYNTENETIELSKKYKCTITFSEVIVNWDGSISLCACDDPESGIIKGNVFKDGIKKVLSEEEFVKARAKSLKMGYDMCRYCIDAKCSV
ncbi:MAG: radical SAM protein [Fibrobacter sp.]|nr:radical SAM protein [Fibrobacter sp.]